MEDVKAPEMKGLGSRTGFLIALVILSGFGAIFLMNITSFLRTINEDILNISKLTSIGIFSEINNELTKPSIVSLTMANDSFVRDWLINEQSRDPQDIITYLNGLRQKYNYDSSFLISSRSLRYFHYNGIFKTVSTENAHDVWYFDLLKKDRLIDLDVDHDEVDKNILTLFVNCKIVDQVEGLLGITGVGIRINTLQKLLEGFEQSFALEAYLIDDKGVVQVHTDVARFGESLEANVFELLKPEKGLQVYFRNIQEDEYVIGHFIEELDWYLIVRKDISNLQRDFRYRTYTLFAIFTAVTILVLLIVIRLVRRFQSRMIRLSQIDHLTGLLNRRGFDIRLKALIDQKPKAPFSVYLYDIDHFKAVNDRLGHLQGDQILIRIVKIFGNQFSDSVTARWGGDEFVGLLMMDREEAIQALESVRFAIESDPLLKEYAVSVSIGVVEYTEIDTEESMMRKADKALYAAKTGGRNRICAS